MTDNKIRKMVDEQALQASLDVIWDQLASKGQVGTVIEFDLKDFKIYSMPIPPATSEDHLVRNEVILHHKPSGETRRLSLDWVWEMRDKKNNDSIL